MAQYEIFQTFSGYRESHKFCAAFVTDLVRQKILQGERELLAGDRLQSSGQAFDLTLDQLDGAFRVPSLDLLKQAKENRAFVDRLARVPQLPTVVDSRGLILRPLFAREPSLERGRQAAPSRYLEARARKPSSRKATRFSAPRASPAASARAAAVISESI